MVDKQQLLEKLRKDVQKIEKQIEYKKMYNVRNYVVRTLAKMGLGMDFFLPGILIAFLVEGTFEKFGNTPFYIDTIKQKVDVETTMTSTGLKIEKLLYDLEEEREDAFFYTTEWVLNDYGLYERCITSYDFDYSVDFEEIDNYLAMSKEEIDTLFSIEDIEIIQKNYLFPEDDFYNEEMLVVKKVTKDEERYVECPETDIDNIAGTTLYLIVVINLVFMYRALEIAFMKNSIRDKLVSIISAFKIFDEEKITELKEILKVKKETLIMLDENSKSIGKDGSKVKRKLR